MCKEGSMAALWWGFVSLQKSEPQRLKPHSFGRPLRHD